MPCRFLLLVLVLFTLTALRSVANEGHTGEQWLDGVEVPPRIFTPEVLAVARKQLDERKPVPFFYSVLWGNSARGSQWTALPDALWEEIIVPYAPLSQSRAGGVCPFCQKRHAGAEVNLGDPNSGVLKCCGQTIHTNGNMVLGGEGAPTVKRVAKTLLDGSVHEYVFLVPKGAEDNPARWLSVDGELWFARMNLLLMQVIPDLTRRLIEDTEGTDVASARTLAAIYSRLADVYEALPFYDPQRGYANYIKNEPAGDSAAAYREQLALWELPMKPWEGAVVRNAVYPVKLFDYAGYDASGRLRHTGVIAEGYDMLLGHPGLADYLAGGAESAEDYEARVRDKLIRPMNAWARQYNPFTGNMITVWLPAAMKLAIVAKDREHLQKAAYYYNSYLRNHFYADGMSIETAFNYSDMLGYLFSEPWIAQEMLGVDFEQIHPLVKRIRELGDFPVVTLAGVESMHADEHAAFFASSQLPPVSGDALDYSGVSVNFPFYGLTALRAGAPGSRLELIIDYQNAILHAHPATLNLQLFYEGVNLLPDVGYHARDGKPTDPRFSGLDYPFELVEAPNWGYEVEGHNTGAALGSQFGHNSVVFERYLGLPQSPVQLAQVDGKWIYRAEFWERPASIPDVSVFNRQVSTFTLPNGQAFALDFFRMKGGWRHDLFWHAPAEKTQSNLQNERALPTANLLEYYRKNAYPQPGWMKEHTYLYKYRAEILKVPYYEDLSALENVRMGSMPAGGWRVHWGIDPARYEPVTARGMAAYAPWQRWMQPVDLYLWGDVLGGGAKESAVFHGDVPWGGTMEMGTLGGNSRLAFKGGLQSLVVHRQGADADSVESTFIHILDPATRKQDPAVRAVRPRQARGRGVMGVAVTVDTNCEAAMLIMGSLEGGDIRDRDSNAATNGRLAVGMPEGALVTLFDGTYFRAADMHLQISPLPQMVLEEVLGDLSGQPEHSALVVWASSPLPTGDVLAGLTVNVEHQTSPAHVSAYEIDSVTMLKQEGLYRIDLRYHPPFIQRKTNVQAVVRGHGMGRVRPALDKDDTLLTTAHHLHDGIGRPNGIGRVLYFPASDFKTKVKGQRIGGYAGWWSDALVPEQIPGVRAVQPGDPIWIYSVQRGDRVVLPATFTCRPVGVDGTSVECEVFSTGAGSLTIGGRTYAIVAGSQTIIIDYEPEQALRIKAMLAAAGEAAAAVSVR